MTMTSAPIVALLEGDEVRAPAPGWFHRTVAADHLVAPGDVIGELEVLGRVTPITAPRIRGLVRVPSGPQLARQPVAYGDVLFTVDASGAGAAFGAVESEAQAAHAVSGLVFRAPTSGRFYGRPGPDKPVFVEAGTELQPGATVCLLEVMKSFHRVTYDGARAKVREVLVADGADVNQGDPLLALDPA
jgi:acetyl-CoA carboxylase biotin carboxyl carrier protein